MPVISDYLERTSKYTKIWAKRYVVYDSDTRKMSYSVNKETPPKSSIFCTRIVRLAETSQIRPHSHDLYAVQIEGINEEGRTDTWTLRMIDSVNFDKWYGLIRGSLVACGMMDSLDYGLPKTDPRNGLPFAAIPLDHVYKFALLEKAILYYFGFVTIYGIDANSMTVQDHVLAIGDRNLYLFRHNADVLRCVPVENITMIYGPKNPDGPNAFAVFCIQPIEHDIIVKDSGDLPNIINIISTVYKSIKNKNIQSQNITEGDIEGFIEAKKIKIRPLEGYKMKAISPTPKAKLKMALDQYKQQHGHSYIKGASKSKSHGKSKTKGSKDTGENDNVDDSLSRLLTKLQLRQYIPILRNQHVDVDLLSCMEPVDLNKFFGVKKEHCESIIKAAQEFDEKANDTQFSLSVSVNSPASASDVSPSSTQVSSESEKVVITLDSDDEDLMPVKNDKVEDSPPLAVTFSGGIMLDDSDDDLGIPIPPKPTATSTTEEPTKKPSIILDDGDL